MAYDAKKAEEVTQQSNLEKNKLYETVIVKLDDGIVQEFIDESVQKKWEGPLDSPAINLTYQIQWGKGKEDISEFSQLFTYKLGEDGQTQYSKQSNLAKYNKQYGKLPEVGDLIQVLTNKDGKPKILMG